MTELLRRRTGGRAVGSLSAALGVVMVAMPISVISAKFNQIFIEQQTGNKVRRRRSDVKRCLAFLALLVQKYKY